MARQKQLIVAAAVATCWSNVRASMVSFGAAVNTQLAAPVIRIKTTGQFLIFSLLKIRKKTSALIACLAIGAASLWGLSMWQDISRQEMLNLLLAILLMLGAIIVAALLLIVAFKLIGKLIRRLMQAKVENENSE